MYKLYVVVNKEARISGWWFWNVMLNIEKKEKKNHEDQRIVPFRE